MNRRSFVKSLALLYSAGQLVESSVLSETYQIDNEFHGVYEMVGQDGNPVNATRAESGKPRITMAARC